MMRFGYTRKFSTLISLSALCIWLFAPLSVSQAQISAPSLTLTSTNPIYSIGQEFGVDIVLDTGGEEIDGIDVRFLHFDPLLLEVISIQESGILSNTQINQFDNVLGTVELSQSTSPPSTYNGVDTVATITFKVKDVGSDTLSFDHTPGNTVDTNIVQGNQDILQSVGTLPLTFEELARTATLSIAGPAQVSQDALFDVDVILDTVDNETSGVDIRNFNFNPAHLEIISVQPGTLMSNTLINTFDNTLGTMRFSQVTDQTGGNFSGSGVLATITLRAKQAVSQSNMYFDFVFGNTTDTNVSYDNLDVLGSVSDLNVEIIAAPVISLDKIVFEDEVYPGETITYFITYHNTSSITAHNVVVHDIIDPNVEYVDGSGGAQSTYDAGSRELTWDIGTVAPGVSAVVTFQVIAQ